MQGTLLEICRCPGCGAGLQAAGEHTRCDACAVDFPETGGIPCLFPDPQRRIANWRRQAQRFVELVEGSGTSLAEQLQQFDLLPSTRRRVELVRRATAEHCERVVDLLRAAGIAPDPRAKASGTDFTLVEFYDHILRDWAWERPGHAENAQARESVERALGEAQADRRLGRVLVLGAGACRLAYDLHVAHAPAMTVALDINPLLLLAAARIIVGGGLRLLEFPSEPRDLAAVCGEHELRAPAPAPERFHFVLADAFTAPFAPGSFDTVVTPWFIDIVPVDIRETLALIHRLLASGGRWINTGPLSYGKERLYSHRYTRDELFELTNLAGFELGAPLTSEVPLLKSPSGPPFRVEQVLTFAARKRPPTVTPEPGEPPAWLLFSHLPIPRFPGLDSFEPGHPLLGYIAGLIDGRATLGDLAVRMRKDHGARADAALNGTRGMVNLVYSECKKVP